MNEMAKEQLQLVIQRFKELSRLYRRAVSHTGVSENEFWIWYTLMTSDGEYSQQDICNTWSLTKQTVNNIITHMVQKGNAVLEVVPETRNRKIIRLTEMGRQYGSSVVTPVNNAEKRALNRLNPEELATCTKALSKFISILKEELDEA